MKNKEDRKATTAIDWLIVFLFFIGVALIAAGLWLFSRSLALVFVGIACLYLAGCASKAANSPRKDG